MKLFAVLKYLCGLMLILQTSFAIAETQKHRSFAARKEVQQFIVEMHLKHGFDKKNLTAHFKKFNTDPKVLALMSKQYEALPWYRYRTHVVTEQRVKEGVLFWQEFENELALAEEKFGVPPEVIVAILGIETGYGKVTGNFPVLQTLATLAFDYPRRSAFFKQELEHFLLLTHAGDLHPTKTLGSFAGAIGVAQFMPSSYRQYAVDFSGKGKRDLVHNTSDVIGSVANYLKTHGWQPNHAIACKAVISGSAYRQLPRRSDHKPHLSFSELKKYQIKASGLSEKDQKKHKAKFIALEGPNQTQEFWIGLHNLYVITRYNNSIHYSMAVYELSQRLRNHYAKDEVE